MTLPGPKPLLTLAVAAFIASPLATYAVAFAHVRSAELVVAASTDGDRSNPPQFSEARRLRELSSFSIFDTVGENQVSPWTSSHFSFGTTGPEHTWTSSSKGVTYVRELADPQGHLGLMDLSNGEETRVIIGGYGWRQLTQREVVLPFVKPFMEFRFVVEAGWPVPYLTGEAKVGSTDPKEIINAFAYPGRIRARRGVWMFSQTLPDGSSVTRAMPIRPAAIPFICVSAIHFMLLWSLGAGAISAARSLRKRHAAA